MIAFLLGAVIACVHAADVNVPAGGVIRSGAITAPEVPELDLPGAQGTLPTLPTALTLPRLEAPQSVEAPKTQDQMALPALESLGEQVKPGAAFTERQFAAKFDGLKEYRAPLGGASVDLSSIDPGDTAGMTRKKAEKKLAKDQVKLDEYQQKLYADPKHKVLIVLQGMDTAGKDGVIRHVMRSLNPQGVQVASFKKPTDAEKKQHWLKRIADHLPGKGMIGIYNRSQYEELLVPSVHPEWYPGMTPEQLDARYETINAFEKELARKGWTIMKFYLHISKDEQKARLQERIDNPDKNWKFSESDQTERKHWEKYQQTYEKILARTNTPWAPWYVVPANNKWYRDYLIGKIVKKTLKRLKLTFPPPNPKLKGVVIE